MLGLGWNLSTTRLLPSLATTPIPSSHARSTFFPAHAAAGKGFGELLKQRQSKGTDGDTPTSSLSPSRGFGADLRKKRVPAPKDVEDKETSFNADEDTHSVCSCGGGDNKLLYTECCMPYHKGTASAPDGLSLLRARYSAYARGIVGYIVSTTHPDNPDFGDNLIANAQATCDQLRFYNLDLLHHESISDQESTVSFRVVYGRKKGGQKDRKVMEEKSYFLREGDTWFFKDGEAVSNA